jgi:hypothetical protein
MAERNPDSRGGVAFQGWISLAVWMAVGLLLESLLAYKSPAYMTDPQRRELFRLAHAHGALLGLLLVVIALWLKASLAAVSRVAMIALRSGAAVMPLGFFVAGIWHPEGDPGFAIWLVPVAALALIFGLISIALASRTAR